MSAQANSAPHPEAGTSTIDAGEISKFARMAEEWWDPAGKFRPLHRINPLRLAYIRDHALAHFGLDGANRTPFAGLNVLDIGCGGGLLSEPLARLGAAVTGIDAGEKNIGIAKAHAAQSGVEVDYRAMTAEALLASGARFDIVLNMEVVEHVDNVPLYMASCAGLVAPGGLLFTSTINRTPRAWALAIVAAENVLRWLPRGTHEYRRFLTPDEIGALNRRNGLVERNRSGVVFHPIADEWRLSRDLGVNYMVVAEKPTA
jgi:2-polyprenyl-6-hydroxyphenyl methylase / 3-demethylubiquinone-9 3-methyltransferase